MSETAVAAPDLNIMPDGAMLAGDDVGPDKMSQFNARAMQGGSLKDPKDGELIVTFFPDPQEEGQHMVEIRAPGDDKNVVVRTVTEYDRLRFDRQWQLYMTEADQLEGQTRLQGQPWIDPGMVNHMSVYGIKTVEQLAAVSDSSLQNIGMGARAMRDKAKKFVDVKAALAGVDEMRAKMEAMQKQLDSQSQQPLGGKGRGHRGWTAEQHLAEAERIKRQRAEQNVGAA